MDVFTKEKRSQVMAAIKGKDTKQEVRLARALWHRGHRYRKHDKTIFGTPDLSFKKYRIAVFVDSEFFHGKDWETKKRPATNAEFWHNKITRNIQRDLEVNDYLTSRGWTVLRFWSDDVKRKLFTTMRSVEKQIQDARQKINYR